MGDIMAIELMHEDVVVTFDENADPQATEVHSQQGVPIEKARLMVKDEMLRLERRMFRLQTWMTATANRE